MQYRNCGSSGLKLPLISLGLWHNFGGKTINPESKKVLFKAFDEEKNYSESAIVTRKSGELIHEITKNVKSENSEKYIFFYSCTKMEEKV